ncbi:MAG: peptide deformylase [Alphaproteobacteria bacterium]|nr:peptide deformylase [Alphaproteobacteria bacterium]
MTKLTIYEIPEPVLRQKAEPVENVDSTIAKTLADMLETMYAGHGVGLAGNQVGLLQRLVVVDCAGEDEKPNPIKLVNPRIIAHSEDKVCHNEGCLSIPKEYADVDRYETVIVAYQDEYGQNQQIAADGLLAVALQHEIDHLDGILFIDYLSKLKRDKLLRHLEKKRRQKMEEEQ